MSFNLPENVLLDAVEIVRDAGQIIKNYFGKEMAHVDKKEGYATKADVEVEERLITGLRRLLPQASFWAEESGREPDQDLCWIIDPLDGTTNFAQGVPYFCVSVALAYKNELLVGIVYNPLRDEMFYAQDGVGAYKDGVKIESSARNKLNECLFATSFSYSSDDGYERSWRAAQVIREKSFSMRHMGSAALDLAHVACGRFDGTFFRTLNWWDVAAGLCIAKVAGAKITDFKGEQVKAEFDSCIVASSPIHNQMLELLKKC